MSLSPVSLICLCMLSQMCSRFYLRIYLVFFVANHICLRYDSSLSILRLLLSTDTISNVNTFSKLCVGIKEVLPEDQDEEDQRQDAIHYRQEQWRRRNEAAEQEKARQRHHNSSTSSQSPDLDIWNQPTRRRAHTTPHSARPRSNQNSVWFCFRMINIS